MIKTLVKHGNSLALVIDKPILDLLKIDANTPLEISTDGTMLTVRPQAIPANDEAFSAAYQKVARRYERVFKRLAQ